MISHNSLLRLKILILYILLVFSNLFGQNMFFKNIGLNEGLSQISGMCIQQDELNRMWIGTRYGLNCWDGVKMKYFLPINGDSSSLIDYAVLNMAKQEKYLWLMCKPGMSRMNLETQKFEQYFMDSPNSIALYNHHFFVGNKKGLLYFNPTQNKFTAFNNKFIQGKNITRLYADKKSNLWLWIDHYGLYQLDARFRLKKILSNNSLQVSCLYIDKNESVWIGTNNDGIYRFYFKTNTTEHITSNGSGLYLPNLTVRTIDNDTNGKIWVGTYQGISVLDLVKNKTEIIKAAENLPNTLTHNSIYSFFFDKSGTVWIGTYFGGVNYTNTSFQTFKFYNSSQSDTHPSYRVIGKMVEDDYNNIWVATEGGGLNYYNRENNKFINYKIPISQGSSIQANIKSISLQSNKKLLVGTYNAGLYIFDIQRNELKLYTDNTVFSNTTNITSIIQYKGKSLIGTKSGIYIFDTDKNMTEPFFKNKKMVDAIGYPITSMYYDSHEQFWIGTQNNGLFKYNTRNKQLKNYKYDSKNVTSVGYNFINQIFEDHQMRVWIATEGGGFSRYNNETDNFRTYTRLENNLPSNFIYGIVESRYGNLWISTNKGLTRFEVEDNKFINYDKNSGIPLNELNVNALMITRKGELFVGGIDGLISFNEEDILKNQSNLKVIFSSLEVNNALVLPNDNSKTLTKDLAYTNSISLHPHQNVFKISFSTCNYNSIPYNKYQYKLEGFNDKWVDAEFNTYVSYTNLSPGKYTLKVRGTNAVYETITPIKELEIIVEPPWYATWFAYLVYAILIIALILTLNYFYISKLRLSYELVDKRKEVDRIQELSQSKLRFFTNISHEFMTPLTLILGSIDSVLTTKKFPLPTLNKLNLAYRNAKRLKHLTHELLDFRKIEQGQMKLKIQQNNIVDYIQEIFDAFSVVAEEREIAYRFQSDEKEFSVWYDPIQMDKVFFNLLSNAFKNTEDKVGIITIKLIDKDDAVEISIIDNGKGIPGNEIDKLFDRFFQIDTKLADGHYQGSGIGLALTKSIIVAHNGTIYCTSKVGEGTTFDVKLNKGNENIDPQFIVNENELENSFKTDKDLIDLLLEIPIEKHDDEVPESNENAPILLIVEDNDEIRHFIKELFQSKYKIEMAKNGAEGLDKALALQPDIIISDVLMPEMSGIEMCTKLKRNIDTSHIPILLLTALNGEEERLEGIEAGADDYITKPFNSRLLQAKVDNIFKFKNYLHTNFKQDPSQNLINITTSKIDQKFMETAQVIVNLNLNNPDFDVNLFAKKMGQSRTVFFSKIKKITGQSPNDLILTIRLKKAAEILIEDYTKNISEISYLTGFNSPQYFARCFKDHFGVSPSNYGKRNAIEENGEVE